MRDFYSILGVKRDAGADEIKSAWRTKAKSVHPDQNRDDPHAHNRFAEIGRAYEVLKDPAKRSRYDQQRMKVEALEREQTIMQQRNAAREAAEKAKQARANAERVLEELARAEAEKAKADAAQAAKMKAAQQQTAEAKPQQQAGAKAETATADAGDKPASAGSAAGSAASAGGTASAKPEGPEETVSRIFGDSPEAAAAAENLRREKEAADLAEGIPLKPAASPLLAPIELFSSLVRRLRGAPPALPEKAPDIFAEAVATIADLLEQKSVSLMLNDGREVRVPLEGVTEGHVVRLKAQGLKFQGLQRGDVLVTVRVLKAERFIVDQFDLRTVLPITLENAVLGCETQIEGPDGTMVQLTVPAWSNSDQVIRIDELGLPNSEGGRGALVVELRVMLWEKPDEKVTDLMRLMREGLYI
ncbi:MULTISPECIES: DnaJ domain-containing protein [Rhizobiaceae]|uniref:DnaJ domain-containing protein n=1 Tax=Peteryoungia algae TaxID=2919917 RepID=A0ABT0CX23_9HYPH|nr:MULTISPECIES: DnaJ domain-containing protein [unclassified Rhizobium]MCC8931070.1 DnaJ domain-containing protein [Rhizobium sp. 'Codium 1']MCJ8237709.1 DnaJ domain-containing protein [Rhizobium sp. SSM4.3]